MVYPSIEFFKVYLSSLSSRELSLPPAFAMQLNGTLHNNVTLLDQTGKVWHVQVEMIKGDVIITDGWQDFVSYHSLVDADFLIFKYDGNSHFDVDIYGKNGLKKEKALDNSMPLIRVKEEKETEEGQTSRPPSGGSKGNYTKMTTKRTRARGSSGRNQFRLSKTAKKELVEYEVAKAAPYDAPKSQQFAMMMTGRRSSQYLVYVPKPVVRACNILEKKDVKLRDKHGRLWPVKVNSRIDGRVMLTSGWLAFWKANKVAIGDECVFEVILAKGKISNVINVEIVRAKTKKCDGSRNNKQ